LYREDGHSKHEVNRKPEGHLTVWDRDLVSRGSPYLHLRPCIERVFFKKIVRSRSCPQQRRKDHCSQYSLKESSLICFDWNSYLLICMNACMKFVLFWMKLHVECMTINFVLLKNAYMDAWLVFVLLKNAWNWVNTYIGAWLNFSLECIFECMKIWENVCIDTWNFD